MIYLIKSAAYSEDKGYFFILKIGYTDKSNLDNRMLYYRVANPTFSLISTRDGDLEDEKKFHEYFKEFKYPELNEWFYYNEKIIKEFPLVDISNVVVTLKSDSIAKRIKIKLMKLLPKDLHYLAKRGNYHYHKGDSEEETLMKFYYSNRLWERGIDHKEFYIQDLLDYKDLLSQYYSLGDNISKRIRFICDLDSSFLNTFLENLTNDDYAKSYYLQIGPTRCKALGYNVAKIRKELGIKRFDKNLMILDILQNFTEGVKIPRSDIKNQLSIIYQKHGYNKVPKATDLEEWFETKAAMITLQDKTRIPGILIVKKK